MTNSNNYDTEELAKFDKLAAFWWEPAGDLKTLHQVNPLRLSYIQEKCSLAGKKVIDIGCGGGILTESLSKAGAEVVGIDLNASLIQVAQLHQLESKTTVDYRVCAVDAVTELESYDVVTCLEMLEHVPDPASIIAACTKLVKPGGHIFFSTLNRNPKSYLFSIVGAEYLLKLLPKNTHDYAKFIKPSELNRWCRDAGIAPQEVRGISYNLITKQFSLTDDISVNYLFYGKKNPL